MGTVKLSGLNDYLHPSPECILPLTKTKKSFEVTPRTDKDVDSVGNQPVKVSLSDCLSCSGCLTSSAPMLENNFYLEVFDKLKGSKCPVLSISTQSLLSLSTMYGLKLTETFLRIKKYFIGKGVKYVFNQSLAEAIQLQESKKEFDKSYKSNTTLICSNCPGWVIYAEKSLDREFLGNMSTIMPLQAIQGLLVKFVVTIRHKMEFNMFKYREIFNPLLLPIININEITPSDIYHLCITPCHDKKLELLRPDLVANYSNLCKLLQIDNDSNSVKTTSLIDGVITTGELEQLLNDDFYNISSVNDELYADSDLLTPVDLESIKSLLGIQQNGVTNDIINSGIMPYDNTEFVHSGGYGEELFKYAAKRYHGKIIDTVKFKNVTNKDFKQATLLTHDNIDNKEIKSCDKPTIKITLATGFRNIANVVSNIKTNLGFNYVELMACPGGCINGGGQIKQLQVDKSYDDRIYVSSDKIPAIIELESWLWLEICRLVDRGRGGLLTMEFKSIKDTRID